MNSHLSHPCRSLILPYIHETLCEALGFSQILHYSAPHHIRGKAKQLSGKGTVILPKTKTISKERGLIVKIVIVTVAFFSRNETPR